MDNLMEQWKSSLRGNDHENNDRGQDNRSKSPASRRDAGFIDLSLSTKSAAKEPAGSVDEKGFLGGIDFTRIAPTAVRDRNTVSSGYPSADQALPLGDDADLGEIQRLITAGIIPSAMRIAEYLQGVSNDEELQVRVKRVRSFIADMLRIEEERLAPSDNSELELLGLLEQSLPVKNLRNGLAKLEHSIP
jgi:hypothetical protein